ncbi:alpha/beta fold hydrolase, partial [Christiangramia aquimixticola]
GGSQWASSARILTKSIWQELIEGLQVQEDFQGFHLIGYSMGGKFSHLTFELFSEQVKSLTLIAPDGIKTGLWYSMSSYPNYFHPFFKRVIFKPQRFF